MLDSLWLTHAHAQWVLAHTHKYKHIQGTKWKHLIPQMKKKAQSRAHSSTSLKCSDFAQVYRINAAQVTQAPGCFWSTLGLGITLGYSALFTTRYREKKSNQVTITLNEQVLRGDTSVQTAEANWIWLWKSLIIRTKELIFSNSILMKLSRPHFSHKKKKNILNLFINLVFNARKVSNAECHHIKLSVMAQACRPRRQRHKDCQFKTTLSYAVRCILDWVMH